MPSFIEELLKPKGGEQKHELYELDWEGISDEDKVHFRTISIDNYVDVDKVLDAMRDRRSIVLMKLRTKLVSDKTEARRAIRRVQKSAYAGGGDIAGLTEDMILVTPGFVKIERDAVSAKQAAVNKARIQAEPEEAGARRHPPRAK